MYKKLFFTFLVLGVASCGSSGGSSVDSNVSATTESGVTTASAALDDANSAGVAIASLAEVNELVEAAVNSTSCTGNWTGCTAGEKTRSMICTTSNGTLSRTLTMDFYDASGAPDSTCAFNATDDYVVRNVTDTTVVTTIGTYTSTYVAANNYLGTSIGGGTTITRTNSSTTYPFSLAIAGITRTLANTAGTTQWNHSIHTDPSAPLVVNQFARDGRIISTGTEIVDHNLAKFTATMVYSDVTYTAGCCYPVAGTIAITLTGTKTGTATVTFSSTCGSATITPSTGSAITLAMTSCSSTDN